MTDAAARDGGADFRRGAHEQAAGVQVQVEIRCGFIRTRNDTAPHPAACEGCGQQGITAQAAAAMTV